MMKNVLLFVFASLFGGAGTFFFLTNAHDQQIKQKAQQTQADSIAARRQELLKAWQASQAYTLTIVDQMPEQYFGFRYTPEAMTFAEQWRHCCIFTCNQLAGQLDLKGNPYEDDTQNPPVEMRKEAVVAELNKMYAYVFQVIRTLPEEKLYAPVEFAGDTIPGWRLLYAMENHIIHHRGQCVVYLRLKGTTPVGYVGW